MSNKIVENIRNTAKEIVKRKIEEELKLSQGKIKREENTILEICNKIQTGFWVKKLSTDWNNTKLVVATLEEFEKDYFNDNVDKWDKGLCEVTETSFKINGIRYFHICHLWEEHNKKVSDFNNKINYLTEQVRDIERQQKDFLDEFKNFKTCLIDYQQLKDKESGKLEAEECARF